MCELDEANSAGCELLQPVGAQEVRHGPPHGPFAQERAKRCFESPDQGNDFNAVLGSDLPNPVQQSEFIAPDEGESDCQQTGFTSEMFAQNINYDLRIHAMTRGRT